MELESFMMWMSYLFTGRKLIFLLQVITRSGFYSFCPRSFGKLTGPVKTIVNDIIMNLFLIMKQKET